MKFDIQSSFGLSSFQNRIVRSSVVTSVVIAVLGVGVAVAAPPNTFKAGDSLSADKLNQNFADLDSRMAAVEARITKANGATKISTNGLYCQATPVAYTGQAVGGYTGARTKCAAACGSPTAHMCSSEELTRTQQLGYGGPSYEWYASGIAAGTRSVDGNLILADCGGWSVQDASQYGPRWGVGTPGYEQCSVATKIACCD